MDIIIKPPATLSSLSGFLSAVQHLPQVPTASADSPHTFALLFVLSQSYITRSTVLSTFKDEFGEPNELKDDEVKRGEWGTMLVVEVLNKLESDLGGEFALEDERDEEEKMEIQKWVESWQRVVKSRLMHGLLTSREFFQDEEVASSSAQSPTTSFHRLASPSPSEASSATMFDSKLPDDFPIDEVAHVQEQGVINPALLLSPAPQPQVELENVEEPPPPPAVVAQEQPQPQPQPQPGSPPEDDPPTNINESKSRIGRTYKLPSKFASSIKPSSRRPSPLSKVSGETVSNRPNLRSRASTAPLPFSSPLSSPVTLTSSSLSPPPFVPSQRRKQKPRQKRSPWAYSDEEDFGEKNESILGKRKLREVELGAHVEGEEKEEKDGRALRAKLRREKIFGKEWESLELKDVPVEMEVEVEENVNTSSSMEVEDTSDKNEMAQEELPRPPPPAQQYATPFPSEVLANPNPNPNTDPTTSSSHDQPLDHHFLSEIFTMPSSSPSQSRSQIEYQRPHSIPSIETSPSPANSKSTIPSFATFLSAALAAHESENEKEKENGIENSLRMEMVPCIAESSSSSLRRLLNVPTPNSNERDERFEEMEEERTREAKKRVMEGDIPIDPMLELEVEEVLAKMSGNSNASRLRREAEQAQAREEEVATSMAVEGEGEEADEDEEEHEEEEESILEEDGERQETPTTTPNGFYELRTRNDSATKYKETSSDIDGSSSSDVELAKQDTGIKKKKKKLITIEEEVSTPSAPPKKSTRGRGRRKRAVTVAAVVAEEEEVDQMATEDEGSDYVDAPPKGARRASKSKPGGYVCNLPVRESSVVEFTSDLTLPPIASTSSSAPTALTKTLKTSKSTTLKPKPNLRLPDPSLSSSSPPLKKCTATFSRPYDLTRHKITVHGGKEFPKRSYEKGGKPGPKEKAKDPNAGDPCLCEKCGVRFSRPDAAGRHRRKGCGRKVYGKKEEGKEVEAVEVVENE